MHLKIKTKVKAEFEYVINHFDEDLFKKLNPPFPPVKLIRFDGSEINDIIDLELNFILFKQKWKSKIINVSKSGQYYYFTDKGIVLPFFLKTWKHKHLIVKSKQGCTIIDDINFNSPLSFLNFFLYPVLLFQFLYRKPVYKKYFK